MEVLVHINIFDTSGSLWEVQRLEVYILKFYMKNNVIGEIRKIGVNETIEK